MREGNCGPWWYAILALGIAIDHSLERIAEAVEALKQKCPGPINTRVRITDKEGHPMPQLPPINLDPAVNDILITCDPVFSDGSPRPAQLLFASSSPSVVIEVVDAKSAKGRCNGNGVATITVTDDAGQADEFQVIAETAPPPQAGPINTARVLIAKGA